MEDIVGKFLVDINVLYVFSISIFDGLYCNDNVLT